MRLITAGMIHARSRSEAVSLANGKGAVGERPTTQRQAASRGGTSFRAVPAVGREGHNKGVSQV